MQKTVGNGVRNKMVGMRTGHAGWVRMISIPVHVSNPLLCIEYALWINLRTKQLLQLYSC